MISLLLHAWGFCEHSLASWTKLCFTCKNYSTYLMTTVIMAVRTVIMVVMVVVMTMMMTMMVMIMMTTA